MRALHVCLVRSWITLALVSLSWGGLFADPTPIEQSDHWIEQREPAKAKDLLEKELALRPTDPEVHWRLSRSWLLVGDLETAATPKKQSYRKALEFADQTIGLAPDNRMGHVGRATALGRLALGVSLINAGGYAKRIRDSATKAIELSEDDPSTKALASYVLGRTHLEAIETPSWIRSVVGVGWANRKDALRFLSQAVEADPNTLMYRVGYAKALHKTGDRDGAIAQLTAASQMKPKLIGDEALTEEVAQMIRKR